MKRKFLLGLVLVLILAAGLVFVKIKNTHNLTTKYKPGSEPVGFRGIEWGTDISTLSGMVKFMSYNGTETYTKNNEDLMIGGAKIKEIRYDFWHGKFIEVKVEMEDYSNWLDLQAATFEKFGISKSHSFQEESIGEDSYAWNGDTTLTLLSGSMKGNTGMIWMSSNKIGKQQETYDKEKAKQKAKEGSEKGF